MQGITMKSKDKERLILGIIKYAPYLQLLLF